MVSRNATGILEEFVRTSHTGVSVDSKFHVLLQDPLKQLKSLKSDYIWKHSWCTWDGVKTETNTGVNQEGIFKQSQLELFAYY